MEEIYKVAIQLPVVVAFVYFALKMQSTTHWFLREQAANHDKALEKIATEIQLLRESFASRKL